MSMSPTFSLNAQARQLFLDCDRRQGHLRIHRSDVDGVAVYDFGVDVPGGLAAGLQLARICMAGLGTVELQAAGEFACVPQIFVATDHPLDACLLSQYAGWKIAADDFFAMGSGPMRAVANREHLFQEFPASEPGNCAAGVLESGQLPTAAARHEIKKCLPSAEDICIAVAPTASQAGNVQVVARSVETAMHKLHEIGFPVSAVISGTGRAPLPPVAKNDLAGIGRTNDAILYGATVNLWVDCDDSVIEEYGPQTPSRSSAAHGTKFMELFEQANHDFYALDKALFSPAVVTFHNMRTGRSFSFGEIVSELMYESFEIQP